MATIYAILTSKPGQFRTEAGPDAEILATYDYLFCGRLKAVYQIARLEQAAKIRVIEETPPHVTNLVPARFFGHFATLDAAREELERLAAFGSLDVTLVKRA
jgi:hypothetical protein